MSRIRPALLAAMVVALAGLAGCGDSSDGPGVATVHSAPGGVATPTSADPVGDTERLRDCLADHGVDLDAIQAGGGDMGALQNAAEQCREFLPNGGELPAPSADDIERGRAFAQCMRGQGIADFPDPNADGTMPEFSPAGTDQAKIAEATTFCLQAVAPAVSPSGSAPARAAG